LVGNTSYSVALERKDRRLPENGGSGAISDGLGGGFRRDQGLGPIGRPCGHDMLSHSCLQEGANAATHKIHLFRHLDNEYCRNILSKIRAKDKENGILVVTEGLFSMDSYTPNLAGLQALCHEFDATLVVDVAHDLAA